MVELLVHGREVTLEKQKAVHARVIWYVPCIVHVAQLEHERVHHDVNALAVCLYTVRTDRSRQGAL